MLFFPHHFSKLEELLLETASAEPPPSYWNLSEALLGTLQHTVPRSQQRKLQCSPRRHPGACLHGWDSMGWAGISAE